MSVLALVRLLQSADEDAVEDTAPFGDGCVIGDMAMLQYCRSQHFERHHRLGTSASWEQRSTLTSMMSCRPARWRRVANTKQAAHVGAASSTSTDNVAREDIIDASLAALREQLEIRSSRTKHPGWVFFVQSKATGQLLGRARLVDCLELSADPFWSVWLLMWKEVESART